MTTVLSDSPNFPDKRTPDGSRMMCARALDAHELATFGQPLSSWRGTPAERQQATRGAVSTPGPLHDVQHVPIQVLLQQCLHVNAGCDQVTYSKPRRSVVKYLVCSAWVAAERRVGNNMLCPPRLWV